MRNKRKNNLQFLPAGGPAEELAADIIETMTGEQPSAMIAVDPEDVLNLLSPPGTMHVFRKNAFWEEDSKKEEALEKLCRDLRQTAGAAQAEYGGCLRILLQIDICLADGLDDGLDEAARCAQALTAEAAPESKVLFQVRIQSGVNSGLLGVRGLIGAWESGL